MATECLEPHLWKQCQSKQEINQYAFPKCHPSHYQTKSFRACSPVPTDSEYIIFNWRQFPELWDGWPENRAKAGKKYNIPLIKEGIFLN